jgi:hypothetical protein
MERHASLRRGRKQRSFAEQGRAETAVWRRKQSNGRKCKVPIYSKEDLKTVYYLHWSIETCYGCLKEELQSGQFSGIRPVCIEQDFAAGFFLFYLQSLTEKQTESRVEAVSRKRKYRYKVNKNIASRR